ncbi:GNAT family N-acetyltransferase [Bacteroides pyogenes]|uniref:GCN5-related N-acetyltransferase n=2 Tax=Bacteroides pyogenes TaxID=310300 RepID=W4PJ44_9BACE|nr:GNAT family N-acetyltransferase [Bacteroides pyogenes]GAE15476.1 GCN5-related N-acetyltransferase [Bacteroides pyogenes JCM 6292]GAE19408.1 GCN5-related N-acetyltransferase [Bacteroides pyogenes DSM 20611 = JCM 6294]
MFVIRKATTEDCFLIHQMAKQVFPSTYQNILSSGQIDYMMEWMYAPDHIYKQMQEQGHLYFIAYNSGIPCGYGSIVQEEESIFHLQKLYVLPSFQGMNCGSFLFKEIIRYIKDLHPGHCRLRLNVNRYNKAIKFYERMEMKKIAEGDFPIGNGYYMNDYIMELEI